jgi:uncharacterized protein (DUF305 family)
VHATFNNTASSNSNTHVALEMKHHQQAVEMEEEQQQQQQQLHGDITDGIARLKDCASKGSTSSRDRRSLQYAWW